MNKYFLIKFDSNDTYSIVDGPMNLPERFESYFGFNTLEKIDPNSLLNLSWLNNPNLGFWLAVFEEKPTCNFNEKLIETHVLDLLTKTCRVSFSKIPLSQSEYDIKQKQILGKVRTIRDQYLKMTDFTQLDDVPISSESKNEFKIFRQNLRDLLNTDNISELSWPTIPTSTPNIVVPEFPDMDTLLQD